MSETNNRMRANMEKVLRVMDIIPPFEGQHDLPGSGMNDVLHLPEPGEVMRSKETASLRIPVRRMSADRVAPRQDDEEVPTLDLGEKILAEQRRRTANTRRGPGVSKSALEPEPEMEVVEREMFVPASVVAFEADAEGVTELHGIVADIVARDIERLCQGLKRAACC